MSALGRLRKKWNYETDVPRCATCINYSSPRIFLKRDSLTGRTKPLCKAGNFFVAPLSCCDNWKSKRGEVLEGITP